MARPYHSGLAPVRIYRKKMVHVCQKCGKEFADRARLLSHEKRRTPCEILPAYACSCGRRYSHRSGLARHRKACELAAAAAGSANAADLRGPTVVITNTTTYNAPVMVNNSVNILAPGDFAAALPGWPKKWPVHPPPRRPFDPPRFTIPLDVLQRAMVTGVKDPEACVRGEPSAVAQLMVEIVRLVQGSPTERNIYMDPMRADQVLVYMPRRWEIRPLLDAVQLTLGRVAGQLSDVLPRANGQIQALAKGAKEGYRARPAEIARSSRQAMAAHLQNMQLRLSMPEGDGWQEKVPEISPADLRSFGEEWCGHLEAPAVIARLELTLEVSDAQTYGEQKEEELARLAVEEFTKMRLFGPGNLTAVVLGGGDALVRIDGAWVQRPAAWAASAQVEAVAIRVAEYIEAGGPAYMQPLAAYLRNHVATMAADEAERMNLLARCSEVAAKHYANAQGPGHAEIRGWLARANGSHAPL